MNAKRAWGVVLAVLCAAPGALAQQRTFQGLAFPSMQQECAGMTFHATLAPDRKSVSILRQVPSKNSPEFLQVGKGFAKHHRRDCRMVLELAEPLQQATVLRVQMRGALLKEPETSARFLLTLGVHQHVSSYARTLVLDTKADLDFMIPVPVGFKRLNMRLQGHATSIDGDQLLLIAVDSFDVCFADLCTPAPSGTTGQVGTAPAAASPASAASTAKP